MVQVVNKYHYRGDTGREVSIMRPSVLGNPFSYMSGTRAEHKVATREEAVQRYGAWLKAKIVSGDPVIMAALLSIPRDAILVCCCKPKDCHGDMQTDATTRRLRRHPLRASGATPSGRRGVVAIGSPVTSCRDTPQARYGLACRFCGHDRLVMVLGSWSYEILRLYTHSEDYHLVYPRRLVRGNQGLPAFNGRS